MTVRFNKNSTSTQRPASTCKLMNSLVVNDWISSAMLDATVSVVSGDTVDASVESSAGLLVGDVLSYRDLLYGMMLPSGNDAAKCLGRSVGAIILAAEGGAGTGAARFIQKMNQKAAALSMSSAVFVDASGLDSGNAMNVADLSTMMISAARVPFLASVSGTLQYTAAISGPNARSVNWTHTINPDGVVKFPEFVCGKTGSTTYDFNPSLNSGSCVSMVWRLPTGGLRVSSIMGAVTALERHKDLRRLMDYEIAKSTAY